MYPLGHLALGYLCYAGVAYLTDRQLPNGLLLVVLAFGTQVPDIIDKPLVYAGVLPSGRSFAHSLLIVLPVLAGLSYMAIQWDLRTEARAFSVAVLSHLIGDSYLLALRGQWTELRFLLWPVIPAIDYPSDDIAPWVRLFNAGFDSPQMQFQYLLVVIAIVIWARSVYVKRTRRTPDR
ncbi:metal-dependent hydrolase [Haloferax profundi]|uniref:Metal-dependent hydrolase n=1 Tax=Haloferax profundi TaxID=1544718 RepID=A0A0W1R5M7_9EURY|nr:metal-dependent hydrolase [Haloferax profundi]KTG08741.1 hypothetical protein AUR66_20235 [Haloferax profundi]